MKKSSTKSKSIKKTVSKTKVNNTVAKAKRIADGIKFTLGSVIIAATLYNAYKFLNPDVEQKKEN